MSYEYLIDSSAWVRYLGGGPGSDVLREIIESRSIAVSIIAIAELADKFSREKRSFTAVLSFIQSRAAILPLTLPIVLSAAERKVELRTRNQKFGLADALQLATAIAHGTILLTFDNDFNGISHAEVLRIP